MRRFLAINPGTEPLSEGSEAEAVANMAVFLEDVALGGTFWVRTPGGDRRNGRFAFRVGRLDCETISVEMPGLPLARVRFTGDFDQSAWDFPRLYLDGASWLWLFAVGIVQDRFATEEEKERARHGEA